MLKIRINDFMILFLKVKIIIEATNIPFQRYKFELLEQMLF